MSGDEKPTQPPVLDNDYEIRLCRPDPREDPVKDRFDAEREEELKLQLSS